MDTSSSRAIRARRRVESRMPPSPRTRVRGMPDTCVNSAVSPSTGSVAITTTASGARRAISGARPRMRPAFTANSSSRRMPGVRMAPAATTTNSDPLMSSSESDPDRKLR